MFRFTCAFEAFRVSSGCHGRWQRVPRCLIGVPTRQLRSYAAARSCVVRAEFFFERVPERCRDMSSDPCVLAGLASH
jgi:hypothetical protein